MYFKKILSLCRASRVIALLAAATLFSQTLTAQNHPPLFDASDVEIETMIDFILSQSDTSSHQNLHSQFEKALKDFVETQLDGTMNFSDKCVYEAGQYRNVIGYYANINYNRYITDSDGTESLVEAEASYESEYTQNLYDAGIERYAPDEIVTSDNRQWHESVSNGISTRDGQLIKDGGIQYFLRPIIPDIIITPVFKENSFPKLGEPLEFNIHLQWKGYDINGYSLEFITKGDYSIDKKEDVTDNFGDCKVQVTMNEYGAYLLTVFYNTIDPGVFFGNIGVACHYYFSLKPDDKWDCFLSVEDAITDPFNYTMEGELAFTTFKYGSNIYEVDMIGGNLPDSHSSEKRLDLQKISGPSEEMEFTMDGPGGIVKINASGAKVQLDEKAYGAFLIFDSEHMKASEKQGVKNARTMLSDAFRLINPYADDGEFVGTTTYLPIMLLKTPLKQGQFYFEQGLLSENVFGFNISAFPQMLESPAELADAAALFSGPDDCSAFPNPLRLTEFTQVANLLQFIGDAEQRKPVVRGTVTLIQKEEPEEDPY